MLKIIIIIIIIIINTSNNFNTDIIWPMGLTPAVIKYIVECTILINHC
jgi:hypothetical protein